MSACLSDRDIEKAEAGLAGARQRAHLTTCVRCAARTRTLRRDLASITRVLANTAEPRPAPARSFRWVPAVAGLAGLAAAALVSIEVVAWRASQSLTQAATAEDVALTLADLSSVLFSRDGEPRRDDAGLLRSRVDVDFGCEYSVRADDGTCPSRDLEPVWDATEMATADNADLGPDAQEHDGGGHP